MFQSRVCAVRTVGFALVAAPCALARPASAQLNFTLADGFQTTAAPPAGSTLLTFSGTLTTTGSFDVDARTFDEPYNVANFSLPVTFTQDFENFYLPFNPGTTYTGTIFQVEVASTTTPGNYNFRLGGVLPALMTFRATSVDGGGSTVSVVESENFGVSVTPSNAPEPATGLLVGAGLVAGEGMARRQRRRSETLR